MARIPDDLVALVAERRLIPFVGAGFSASLGLPSWESLLSDVCEHTDGGVDFDALKEATQGDYLQMAEYLYLRHDRQIGPIRHQIETSFARSTADPVMSGAHVELVNLGAGQIYTTNYDDIIERLFKTLGRSAGSIVLPKDVALADPEQTQIVKYHGDLKHERTLVLTESAYYKRLDFESPMDLKFRSDLLGKSVLFMGYSFRDVNIRIIWFKLMEMMRDVPEADRRPSYILRFEPNEALEELYAAVGLRTIVLNPDGADLDAAERTALLGRFLLDLSLRAERRSIPMVRREYLVSSTLLDSSESMADRMNASHGTALARLRNPLFKEDARVERMLTAAVPEALRHRWEEIAAKLLPVLGMTEIVVGALKRITDPDALLAFVVGVLAAVAQDEARNDKRILLASDVPWQTVWRGKLSLSEVNSVLDQLWTEITYQATRAADEDLAFLVYLAARISRGELLDSSSESDIMTPEETVERATALVQLASEIYPAVTSIVVDDGPPELSALLSDIARREANFKPVQLDFDIMGPAIAGRSGGYRLGTVGGRNNAARVPRPAAARPRGNPPRVSQRTASGLKDAGVEGLPES